MPLNSLPPAYRAVVFGAGGGIGAAILEALVADARCAVVYAGMRGDPDPVLPRVHYFQFDLEDEESIASAASVCSGNGLLHLVVVATGLLHDGALQPEKTWRSISAQGMRRAFAVNTIGPALIAKHFLGNLAHAERSVFAALSARVGSISDNRLGGWHAYRASKAALNMLMRNFAIELRQRNRQASCVALHPGTVATALSRPFQGNVKPGQLMSAAQSAAHLLDVIDHLEVRHSGTCVAWDRSLIPP